MALTAAEQYLLELINRARLDPAAEAARQGVALTAGGADVSGAVKQVLAPSGVLQTAATNHTNWMFANDIFSHQGAGGDRSVDRAADLGYVGRVGENLSWLGLQGSTESWVQTHFDNLWASPVHRPNTMRPEYREVGLEIANGIGGYQAAPSAAASIVTEVFGVRGSNAFVTGVAYTDRNDNSFYNMGEGREGVRIASGRASDLTEGAGGYGIAVAADDAVAVRVSLGRTIMDLTVDTRPGNVKIDVVDGTWLHLSGDFDMVTNTMFVRMIGAGNLDGKGSDLRDLIIGNKGRNLIEGEAGWDRIEGGAGYDTLRGNEGNDLLRGDGGNDALSGGDGADTLNGGTEKDYLAGNTGNDVLWGMSGADRFAFARGGGADRIGDFSGGSGDRLVLDDALWVGRKTAAQVVEDHARINRSGDVVLDFGRNGSVELDGVTSTRGLADYIQII